MNPPVARRGSFAETDSPRLAHVFGQVIKVQDHRAQDRQANQQLPTNPLRPVRHRELLVRPTQLQPARLPASQTPQNLMIPARARHVLMFPRLI
jgi:hypothetical protein